MIRARWLNIDIDKINMSVQFHLVLFLMRPGKETDFKRKSKLLKLGQFEIVS